MGCTDSVCLPVKGNIGSDFQSFNHNQGSGANQQKQQFCQGRKCYQNNRRGQGSQTCVGGICRQDNENGGSNHYKPSEGGQFQPGTGNRGQNQPGMQQSFPNSGFTGNGGHGQDGTRNGGHNGGNGQVGTRYGGHGQVGPRNGGHSQGGYQQKCSNGSKCQVTYGDYDEQFFTDDF